MQFRGDGAAVRQEPDMPIVQISVAEGRTPEQLRALLAAVHRGVQESLDAPAESIRVLVTEVPRELWLSGTQTLAEKAAVRS